MGSAWKARPTWLGTIMMGKTANRLKNVSYQAHLSNQKSSLNNSRIFAIKMIR
jgi:hypothetical protein